MHESCLPPDTAASFHLRTPADPNSSQLNLTICLSILSIGIASVFAGSRVLTGLAATGLAPRIFAYVDESSRPLFSFISVLMFGSFVNLAPNAMGDKVFNWLVAIS
ncbi:hypothetical protein Rt10032_c05g2319 [Rhodotorula toruloides]|uniref:Amino acid permease/ SLC12A domain-containing protein n=1 Tax=Rhodotorula toruloides TaxID=5286 RepID=A0A511KDD2_RHOTO|nr:hypothetical protein Rt10032_c05g2319 [Rhodotorula toruloides]